MALYENRHKFEYISVKIGIIFSRLPLSPNQWTLFTLVPTFVALYFLVHEQFLQAAGLFIVAAFIDLIDGAVARATGKVSKIGGYLDTIVDRYVEGIILFGLLFASLPPLVIQGFTIPSYALVFVLLFGGTLTTYAKAAAREKSLVDTEIKGGLLERAERMLLLFIGILAATWEPLFLTGMLALLAFLSNITALQRIRKAIRLAKA